MDTMHIDQVHFIGVGGVGMSGIARVAFDQGMVSIEIGRAHV